MHPELEVRADGRQVRIPGNELGHGDVIELLDGVACISALHYVPFVALRRRARCSRRWGWDGRRGWRRDRCGRLRRAGWHGGPVDRAHAIIIARLEVVATGIHGRVHI